MEVQGLFVGNDIVVSSPFLPLDSHLPAFYFKANFTSNDLLFRIIRIISTNEVGPEHPTAFYPPSLQCCTSRLWSHLGQSDQVNIAISSK